MPRFWLASHAAAKNKAVVAAMIANKVIRAN
jgi:hypothetical protein